MRLAPLLLGAACGGGGVCSVAAGPGVDLDASGTGDLAVTTTGDCDAVTVTLVDPPDGIHADPLTLPAGATGALRLRADPGTRLDTTIQIAGSGAGEATAYLSAGVTSGRLDTSFGLARLGDCEHLAVSPGGRVLAAMVHLVPMGAIAALTPAGAFDEAFGTSGFAIVPGRVVDLGFDSDGALVVLARADPAVSLSRLQADGAPDPGFGILGTVELHDIVDMSGERLLGVRDGLIYVSHAGTDSRRYRRDSTLDGAYHVLMALPPGFSGLPLFLDDGGWLWVGAQTGAAAAVRFDAAGQMQRTHVEATGGASWRGAVADGAGGFYVVETGADTRIVHLGADLGVAGRSDAVAGGSVRVLGADHGGRAVVAARAGEGARLLRYGPDGRIDPSFRIDGQGDLAHTTHGLIARDAHDGCAQLDGSDGLLWFAYPGVVRIDMN